MRIPRASARASATDPPFAAIVLAKMLSYTTVSSACVTAVDARPAQSCAARADTVTVVSPIFIVAPSHVAVASAVADVSIAGVVTAGLEVS